MKEINDTKKIAIIGASYLQKPLVEKAKNMGLETHVFAWEEGAVCKDYADFFYPISITEKEEILSQCKTIGVNGICSIASDIAVVTVNYVAENMGLVGNTIKNTLITTNKHWMRKRFAEKGVPSPRSFLIKKLEDTHKIELDYPIIVKPTDRSGSRGVSLLKDKTNLEKAVEYALGQSFENCAVIEEYVEGKEYSVECISYKKKHHMLAVTKKYTTGNPHFIETGHEQPVTMTEKQKKELEKVVFKALESLEIQYGASHTELKINDEGVIKIIEIGARMGGDLIGSTLVEESTGIDFLRGVLDVSLGIAPDLKPQKKGQPVAIRFILTKQDYDLFLKRKMEKPETIIKYEVWDKNFDYEIKNSADRKGYFVFHMN